MLNHSRIEEVQSEITRVEAALAPFDAVMRDDFQDPAWRENVLEAQSKLEERLMVRKLAPAYLAALREIERLNAR